MERLTVFVVLLFAGLAVVSCAMEPEATPPGPPAEEAATAQPREAATAQPQEEATMEPAPTDEPEETPSREERLETPVTRLPELIPTQLPQTPVTGEAPAALVNDMIADLSSRVGVPEAEISVETAESLVWRDGSMGCPQPGMSYTMALVPGYRVVLVANGTRYNYHASERGSFILCEGGGSKPGVAPGTDALPKE